MMETVQAKQAVKSFKPFQVAPIKEQLEQHLDD